jgi:hypothetical protein
MVNFNNLLEAVKNTPGITTQVVEFFETTFRSGISGLDISLLLDGNIPKKTISNLLESSLVATAQFCLDLHEQLHEQKFKDIANMLWSPLTAMLLKDSTLEPCHSCEAPPTKKVAKKEKKISAPVSLTETQIASIRGRLRDISKTKTHLYQTSGHSHVKCDVPKCEFCYALFTCLNITRCEGHKRCSTVGWYPHVGPSLWQMLKKKHARHEPHRLSVKPCKPNELPGLSVGTEELQSATTVEDMDSQSNGSTPTATPPPSPRSLPQQSPSRRIRDVDWNTLDLEQVYLDQHKRARVDLHPQSP